VIKGATSVGKTIWNRAMKGGAALDVENLPPPSSSRTAAQKTAIANKLAVELKNAAHYYAYRAPATSLGYRVIADELFKKAPTLQGQPERKMDAGHDEATKLQMGRVVWGDAIPNVVPRTKTRHFADIYAKNVEPEYEKAKKANPTMSHNEIKRYVETMP
jgi:hypothetical protein